MSLKFLLIVTFSLNVVLAGGMRFMLMLIRALQITLHLPLLKLAVPANVSSLFQIVIPIATFDVLDPDWTTKLVFTFDEEKQNALKAEMLPQMVDLGYETHSSILNLGSLSLFTAVYNFEVLVYLGMLAWRALTGRQIKAIKAMESRLFFGDLIALLIDAYFEFLLSSYLQLQHPLSSTGGEQASSLFGWLSILLVFGFLNFGFLKVLTAPLVDFTSNQAFIQRWGQLFAGLRTGSRASLFYFPLFAGRRLLFLVLAFGFSNCVAAQLLGVFALNLFISTYLGQYAPVKDPLSRRIEMANEFLIATVTYLLVLFTDWVDDPETQYFYGWFLIFLMACLILFNLYFVLTFGIYQARLASIKAKNQLIVWLDRVIQGHMAMQRQNTSKSALSGSATGSSVDLIDEEVHPSAEMQEDTKDLTFREKPKKKVKKACKKKTHAPVETGEAIEEVFGLRDREDWNNFCISPSTYNRVIQNNKGLKLNLEAIDMAWGQADSRQNGMESRATDEAENPFAVDQHGGDANPPNRIFDPVETRKVWNLKSDWKSSQFEFPLKSSAAGDCSQSFKTKRSAKSTGKKKKKVLKKAGKKKKPLHISSNNIDQ